LLVLMTDRDLLERGVPPLPPETLLRARIA
jgi:hypothetical protein